jgi:hypothetical protein
MYSPVQDVIARCEQCDRVRTFFLFLTTHAFSTPIHGMLYRRSCYLVGELP